MGSCPRAAEIRTFSVEESNTEKARRRLDPELGKISTPTVKGAKSEKVAWPASGPRSTARPPTQRFSVASPRRRGATRGVMPRGVNTVLLDGDSLTLHDIREVALGRKTVGVAEPAKTKVQRAPRPGGKKKAQADEPTYGINTGFGTLAEVRIDKADLKQLQRNLNPLPRGGRRRAAGDPRSARDAAAARERARQGPTPGCGSPPSSCSPRCQPRRHSGGAGGAQRGRLRDLAPLAHLALVLIGEGEAFFHDARLPGAEALKRAGLQPLVLEAKEGLTLVNGTQAMCGVACRRCCSPKTSPSCSRSPER